VVEGISEAPTSSPGNVRVIVSLLHKGKHRHLDQIADTVVLAPPSTVTLLHSTPSLPISNGRNTPLANSTLTNDDAPYDSESDLSEVAIPMIEETSPASSSNHQSEFGGQQTDASDSPPENQEESDDADFDMEDSPAPAATNGRDDRSTSVEFCRPAKRKLGVEDEHMLANPELYGLRRSVCGAFI
jgi:chromodomain-helicase-DNA-binding protein 1